MSDLKYPAPEPMQCSSKPPSNELCYKTQMPNQMEQCPKCLRVFCYNCIQQHGCQGRMLFELEDVLKVISNCGFDSDCGACAEIAFTGSSTHDHTCKVPA